MYCMLSSFRLGSPLPRLYRRFGLLLLVGCAARAVSSRCIRLQRGCNVGPLYLWHWLVFGTVVSPRFTIVRVQRLNRTLPLQRGLIHLVFAMGALRTNLAFVWILTWVTSGAWHSSAQMMRRVCSSSPLVTAAYFVIAAAFFGMGQGSSNVMMLLKTGGALAFIAAMGVSDLGLEAVPIECKEIYRPILLAPSGLVSLHRSCP